MLPDETALISACQSGDLTQFDPLYREYVKPIFGFIYRRTASRQTAEDLTSMTFMKALEKINTFSPKKGPFAAWLYRIARNTVTDHYRTSRPSKDIEDVWDLSSEERVDAGVDDRMKVEEIVAAIKDLDPLKRDIVLMRVWDGLSYQEIAAITGKSESNCKVIYSRTLADLRLSIPIAALLLLFLSPPSL